jgi:peptidoglycan LD-endopeptidase LytH
VLVLAGILSTGACDPRGAPAAAPERDEGLDAVPLVTRPVVDAPVTTQVPHVAEDRLPGGGASGELAELSAGLGVPVAGVARSELRDSYDEPRGGRLHEAMDILVPRGTPVVSAADGTLLKLFDSEAGGLMVYAMDPSERFVLLYGHLDGFADGLVEGMRLVRGQVIGYVGTTGNAPEGTPHLHFAILRGRPAVEWWSGVPVNPYPLLVP